MNSIRVIMVILTLLSRVSTALKIDIATHNTDKMKLLIAIPHDAPDELCIMSDIIRSDLSFSDQCAVTVQKIAPIVHKKDVQQYAQKGFPLLVYLASYKQGKEYEWRLYSTLDMRMIHGKKVSKKECPLRGYAHMISDMIWPKITAQPGFFSTKIAYSKKLSRSGTKKDYGHIYIADYDGSNEQLLVGTPTVNVGPRFNRDPYHPLLFYSQFGDENVELMVTDMNKKSSVISTFDGVNMLPSFSDDGKKVVYCASKGTGNCQIYYFENKKLQQITNNDGNNISPALNKDGTKIYFCSDFQKRPSIYCFDRKSRHLERITSDASSMSPVYCSAKDQLAYCKRTSSGYQLFTYDCTQKKHVQRTFDDGHKSEPSWSTCGNYLLYSVERGSKQSLEVFNMLLQQQKALAIAGSCSYPSWSMPYKRYASVRA